MSKWWWTVVAAAACQGPDGSSDEVPDPLEPVTVMDEDDGLTDPRDLGFDGDGRLWVANRKDDRTYIVDDPAAEELDVRRLQDGYAEHFMEETVALSFDDDDQFGSCGDTRNTYNGRAPANDFMGPALWSTDLAIFAVENPIGLGSHLDMLHQSPQCMGMAWEINNIYWVFDGYNGNIVRYDFAADHGPGYDDHSDGKVRRLQEPEVKRVKGAPSHMVIDFDNRLLYVADTGNDRVLWIDVDKGSRGRNIQPLNEPLAEYYYWKDVSWGVVTEDIEQPGALALDGDVLYVGSWATGVVHTIRTDGEELASDDLGGGAKSVSALEIGPDGALWGLNNKAATVWRAVD